MDEDNLPKIEHNMDEEDLLKTEDDMNEDDLLMIEDYVDKDNLPKVEDDIKVPICSGTLSCGPPASILQNLMMFLFLMMSF